MLNLLPHRPLARLTTAILAAAALALTGCSGGDDGEAKAPTSDSIDAATDASGDSTPAVPDQWNPCDGLSPAGVGRLVGEPVTVDAGTPEQPRCTIKPKRTGGAAYDVSYLWFDGGLDAALGAMGDAGAQLKSIDVPGAEAARLAVNASDEGLLVTGFVQTEGLVQSVNAAQLKPYDRAAVVAGAKALLAELAAKAPVAAE